MKNRLIKKRATKYAVIISALFSLNGCSTLYGYLGGNFTGSPAEMEKNLSPTAKKLIESAFEGINPDEIIDYHLHMVGLGDGTPCIVEEKSSIFLNPKRLSFLHPLWKISTGIFMDASGISSMENANVEYAYRLLDLVRHFRGKGKFHIFAMDGYHEEDGTLNIDKTDLMVPNQYIIDIAYCLNGKLGIKRFVPIASIHPYRKDAIAELEKYAKKGVRFLKWLPNTMNIDPSKESIIPFYKKMAELGVTLISHTGDESVLSAHGDLQKYGNPLLLKNALDNGVRVIMAHSGRDGYNMDDSGARRLNFDLFMEMMAIPEYKGRLFGELSAFLIRGKRNIEYLKRILNDKTLSGRMVNGSDYPIPAVNILQNTSGIAKAGLITPEEKKAVDEIYGYNPLLFDFVLKRTLRHPLDRSLRLPASMFTALKNAN